MPVPFPAKNREFMDRQTNPIGYCTNVHAGPTLEIAQENLGKYACRVRDIVNPEGQLPVGLWLSEVALQQVQSEQLADWLAERKLLPYTLNGFPQKDFHQPVVKHAVYMPTWESQERLRYTCDLADLLSKLLPEGAAGSISTLPLGWPHQQWTAEQRKRCAEQLVKAAEHLHRLRSESGHDIVLAIEPEPGCVLNTAQEIVDFFREELFELGPAEIVRHHLTVCHDICHSSVMFESQQETLELYRRSGIRVGKVQVSSAVHVPWGEAATAEQKQAILEQLRQFDEPKYLHQTTRQNASQTMLVEDLSDALRDWRESNEGAWRVHFHIPIFVNEFGVLRSTQEDITEAVSFLEHHKGSEVSGSDWFTGHYEVETYAWPVLPEPLAESDLAQGIAKELQYLDHIFGNL